MSYADIINTPEFVRINATVSVFSQPVLWTLEEGWADPIGQADTYASKGYHLVVVNHATGQILADHIKQSVKPVVVEVSSGIPDKFCFVHCPTVLFYR